MFAMAFATLPQTDNAAVDRIAEFANRGVTKGEVFKVVGKFFRRPGNSLLVTVGSWMKRMEMREVPLRVLTGLGKVAALPRNGCVGGTWGVLVDRLEEGGINCLFLTHAKAGCVLVVQVRAVGMEAPELAALVGKVVVVLAVKKAATPETVWADATSVRDFSGRHPEIDKQVAWWEGGGKGKAAVASVVVGKKEALRERTRARGGGSGVSEEVPF